MPRILLAAIAALLLVAPATANGAGANASSGTKLRGTVAQTLPDNGLIRVDTRRVAHILRVPGSQSRIQVGQRVELRGKTLREHGNGSRVLARGVVVAASAQKGSSGIASGGSSSDDAGKLEVRGKLTSLSPPTVVSGSVTVTCALPAGRTLAGFAVGDFVELKCVLRLGVWMLRDLKHEDDEVANPPDDDTTDDTTDDATDDDTNDDDTTDDDDDNSGPGGGDN